MSTMPETQFWDIIEKSLHSEEDRQLSKLEKQLKRLSPTEIVAFHETFTAMSDKAYRHDLWGAAYVIDDGCSDDGFMDFRSWLIAQGRAVFEAAMRDPESLADYIKTDFAMFEEIAYVDDEVYEEKTHDMLPDSTLPRPQEPAGTKWDEASLDKLYPRLTAKVAEFE